MKTENMKVKCLRTFASGKFTEGQLYDVLEVNKGAGRGSFTTQLVVKTNRIGICHHVWMPNEIKNGDVSFAECFELVIEEPKSDDIMEAMQYSIDCALRAGGPIHAALRDGFSSRCLLIDTAKIYPGQISMAKVTDPVSSTDVLMELRNVLRCPEGANIVIWAEILAAGYFGEKHHKGGAVEDAIHYKKNGAYSDDALAKILTAIVNDGTNC